MRRATVTIPGKLEASLDSFVDAQPARPSLASVVEAALEAYLLDPPVAPSKLPAVMRERARIGQLAHTHGVEVIALFGSVASGSDGPGSDVDFWVEADSPVGLFEIAALRHDLTDLLGCPVDVVTLGGLEQAERDRIVASSLPL